MDARVLQRVAAGGMLETLRPIELQLDLLPVTIDPQPKPVKAWVRFGDTPIIVDAEACRWTTKAVGIRFLVDGAEHRCWVWLGAVTEV